jgi:LysR family transcriptional activator of nhaA
MNHLNYHHLQYFWIVAKEGNLTRAAKKLHISQSALSAQIRLLEDQLGQTLFLRAGRALKLTEAGQAALGFAENIFSAGNELLALMREGRSPQRQTLRIGSVATLSRNFQENFLKPLLGEPGVQLSLSSGSLDELLAQLKLHNLHLILSNKAVSSDTEYAWRCHLIDTQPVCLVGRPRTGHAAFRFPEDLASERLLLPGPKSEMRSQFDMLCEHLGIHVDVLAEVDDMAMLRLLARDSPHLALLPAVVVQDELREGRLEQLCVVPQVQERFYAITVSRRFQPHLLQQLLQSKKENMQGPEGNEPV